MISDTSIAVSIKTVRFFWRGRWCKVFEWQGARDVGTVIEINVNFPIYFQVHTLHNSVITV